MIKFVNKNSRWSTAIIHTIHGSYKNHKQNTSTKREQVKQMKNALHFPTIERKTKESFPPCLCVNNGDELKTRKAQKLKLKNESWEFPGCWETLRNKMIIKNEWKHFSQSPRNFTNFNHARPSTTNFSPFLLQWPATSYFPFNFCILFSFKTQRMLPCCCGSNQKFFHTIEQRHKIFRKGNLNFLNTSKRIG